MLDDLRLAIRSLRRTPGFFAIAALTLGLGVGANTAMFSVVKAVLLSQLPYPEPGRLVQLWESTTTGHLMRVSGPNFTDWQAQNHSMEALAADGGGDAVVLTGANALDRVRVRQISTDFFRVMKVQPALGRVTSASDHRQGAAPVAVIGHGLWQRAFGSDPAVSGRLIHLRGLPFTVVGVMPAGFDFPENSEVWIPRELFPDTSTRSAHNYSVFGRLKAGVSIQSAQAELDTIAAGLAAHYIDDKDRGIRAVSLYNQITGPVRPALLILLGAVGFVLLIACVNIANLQLARGWSKARELALRSALGAARSRLARQLLTESLLIAITGGMCGFLLAAFSMGLLRAWIPPDIPRVQDVHIDLPVFAFTMAAALLAGLVFGLLPAFSGSYVDVNGALKEGSGKATMPARQRRLGNLLVVSEVAVATVLLVGAGLLIQTFRNLENVDPGFNSAGILAGEVSWPVGGNADTSRSDEYSRQMMERVRAIPGVMAAGAINSFPIRESGSDGSFEIAGRPLPADPHDAPDAYYRVATAGYFETMGIPLRRGRAFTTADERPGAPQIAVVNEKFVDEFFPNEDAIGKRIRFFGFDEHPQFLEIVGVVNNIRAIALNRPPESEVFADGFQHAGSLDSPTLVVRAPFSVVNAIRAAIRSVSQDVPLTLSPVNGIVQESVSRQRFQMSLLTLFAGLALLLAAIGIYGVQSNTVNRRVGELGIRLALGADRPHLLGMILRESFTLVAAGLVVGIGGALLLTRTMSGLLYGVSPTDPLVYASIGAALVAVALVASFIPARRAAGTDPMVALRYE